MVVERSLVLLGSSSVSLSLDWSSCLVDNSLKNTKHCRHGLTVQIPLVCGFREPPSLSCAALGPVLAGDVPLLLAVYEPPVSLRDPSFPLLQLGVVLPGEFPLARSLSKLYGTISYDVQVRLLSVSSFLFPETIMSDGYE